MVWADFSVVWGLRSFAHTPGVSLILTRPGGVRLALVTVLVTGLVKGAGQSGHPGGGRCLIPALLLLKFGKRENVTFSPLVANLRRNEKSYHTKL